MLWDQQRLAVSVPRTTASCDDGLRCLVASRPFSPGGCQWATAWGPLSGKNRRGIGAERGGNGPVKPKRKMFSGLVGTVEE